MQLVVTLIKMEMDLTVFLLYRNSLYLKEHCLVFSVGVREVQSKMIFRNIIIYNVSRKGALK